MHNLWKEEGDVAGTGTGTRPQPGGTQATPSSTTATPRYHERYPSLAAVNATYTPKKPSTQKPNARQPSANEGALEGRLAVRRTKGTSTPSFCSADSVGGGRTGS